MDEGQLQQIRRFNRLVTRRVGALEVDYLRRGRSLAEARLIFEIGPNFDEYPPFQLDQGGSEPTGMEGKPVSV